jgi:hypothetical protein
MHDKTVYVEKGLQDKIPQGKKVITDQVYGNKAETDNYAKLSLPNPMNTRELANLRPVPGRAMKPSMAACISFLLCATLTTTTQPTMFTFLKLLPSL